LVKSVLGAKRWIRLGPVSLSPVEFFKIGFVFFISWSFSRKFINYKKIHLIDEFKMIFPYLILLLIAVMFIAVFQKDLGQVVVLSATFFILMTFAGRSAKLSFALLGVGLIGVVALIVVAPHRMIRIKSWWITVQDNILQYLPNAMASKLRVDVTSQQYQISNALNAIHNGGLFGQGLGNGQFKLGYLSEVNTDFVLAGSAEELGFLGLLIISLLMIVIMFRIFRIASKVENPVYHLFAIGVGSLIMLAFLINSYGISGMIPIKGIAVPFLSYGGSHIISASVGIGMVLMISKKRKLDTKSEYMV